MRLYGCGYNYDSSRPGIWLFDLVDGKVCECGGVENPSYGTVVTLPNGRRMLYTACELEDCAELAAFEIDGEGVPSLVDVCRFDGASGICFVLVSPDCKSIYGADYNSGSICSCRLNDDGTFGAKWPLVQDSGSGPARFPHDPNFARQLSAHVHTLSFIPHTRLLAAVDLGTDSIYIYDPASDGDISESQLTSIVITPKGCGPRIIAYHPTLPLAAVVCELSCEVLLYKIVDGSEKWELVGRHGLLDGKPANPDAPDAKADIPESEYPPLSAHAEFSTDGKFLYVSTRGTNTITIFRLDSEGRAAEWSVVSCGGHSPRHFAISPDQKFLAVANQVSNEITIFERDNDNGGLTLLRKLECHEPSCAIWDN